ncbi:aminotransferase class I/II-fold pyridoxal phosphate-dependent enzyme [Limnobacter humi]|uniref:8-amino-7-oxononanoate synthase n=1 Tax=Limnobacter humi TaxID=1778671 RepID=A0ABT1WDL3_9BURK|nr:aminotransferase class I/II-fold pyridoxal phosphate-dependent enzyme [Limnobacter humi]MCQ8895131.1 aminotransferase class I/II-fold pyridoxal phosphate-dependent enzyme [Limnobacter humi]
MTLNDAAAARLDDLQHQHLKRALLPCPVSGRAFDFSSNDYLCLSTHPEVVDAGMAMARRYGAGATGSRLLSGNLDCFEQLEAQIARFKQAEAALLYATGYQANSSGLAALLDKTLWAGQEPLVFSDRLNHASLHHACQLAGVKQLRFRHNDFEHLTELLNKHRGSEQPKIIVTETVFGMEGDLLLVEELAELALGHRAVVYLDEAHATGVWGPEGRGLGALQTPAIEALKAMGHWVVMGTFSKGVGVSGAYIACSAVLKHYLLNRSTGFVYSTAPSPFVVGAIGKALELIPALEPDRQTLQTNAQALRDMLHAMGFNTGLSNTHIVPVLVGQASHALALKDHLLQLGIRASAIRPPTVPPHTARVRLALNTGHHGLHVHALVEALRHWSTHPSAHSSDVNLG